MSGVLPVVDTRMLVKKAQNNDLDAFEELVRIYQHRVYSLSLHLAGNESDAQDLAQEAMIRAYRSLRGFRQEADFGTWLHRITVNVWLNFQRQNRSRKIVSLNAPQQGKDGSEIPRELAADEDSDPLAAVETKEFQALVRAGLQELSEEHRAVLVLREIEGYSYEEVAQMLNCNLGTVKSRLNRARQMLKQKMTALAREAGVSLPGDRERNKR